MRDVSSRVLDMSLSGGSMRIVSREVRLTMVDECGVPVRLMTIFQKFSKSLVTKRELLFSTD
jgi:hypothetical protein